MKKEVVILIAEDDDGHASLIRRNLRRAGVSNDLVHFRDGQEVLDFLFRAGEGPHRKAHTPYLLLLDIRMPRVSGAEVLEQIKKDSELNKLPVIMVSTTDDPREIEKCHRLGCNSYVTKPIDYVKFVEAIRQLGLFLLVVEVPVLNGDSYGES